MTMAKPKTARKNSPRKTTSKTASAKAGASKTVAKVKAPAEPVVTEPTVTGQIVTEPVVTEPVAPEGSIPLPQDAVTTAPMIEEVPKASTPLTVVDAPPTAPVGVTEQAPVVIRQAPVASDAVVVRALVDLDAPPHIGAFNFVNVTGRDIQSGKPVRGRFANGANYTVPAFVAEVLVEKRWAITV
jgi:hypothetical protein